MENSFLYQIAKAYVEQKDIDLRKCLFVFPSRRSSLFFQKYLGRCSDAPLFSPDIITIGDLFARLSPYRRGDKIQLMYILWQKYSELRGAGAEGFDYFVSLGETIMADFNDVDKYMVDADKLFRHIGDLHALDNDYDFLTDEQKAALKQFWGVIARGKDSEAKAKFLGLWDILPALYDTFCQELSGRGIAYEGMMQREVAERLQDGAGAESIKAELAAYDRIVVVGQNALCNCERALYDHIKKEFDGDFYWDFYGGCLTDPDNKASHFIKAYIGLYPSKYELEAETDGRPEITVVAASSAVAQAKVAAAHLAESDQDSTAVVLPDENLLMPLLNSIPENISKVNVTMGYGLHNSATASLMDMMAGLQMNARNTGFYHKDVTAILNHPFIRNAAPVADQIKAQIIKDNEIYVPQGRFAGDVILEVIFRPVAATAVLSDWQMEVLSAIAPTLTDIEKEFAHGYYTAVSHLKDLDIPMEPHTYFRFLREITSRLTVDFRGEPLSGLQVMGPLEVRAIDFDTLIILSVNEGVYPAKQQSDSLIPYNVRRGFGLPTVELFDSISAYHFYRSIYRAKKVVLIYDSRTKATLSGEESRFVKQLKYIYDYPMTFKGLDLEIKPVEKDAHCVEKTPEVMKQLIDHFLLPREDGKYNAFSASSILSYVNCPLKFYYSQVVGLSEEDEISEEVDASQFGNTFHHTMEDLYAGFKGKPVNKSMLESIDDALIGDTVAKNLNKELNHPVGTPLIRRNQITANLVSLLVKETLRNDKEYEPFTYVDSEKELEKEIPVMIDGKPKTVWLRGFIDRLDRKNDRLRVCDYKTGSVAEADSYVYDTKFEKIMSGEKKTSFQLLFYALLLTLDDPSRTEYELAVYDVKKLFESRAQSKYCPPETVEIFKARLVKIIEEIFNRDVPFRGVEADNKTCEYCPAKAICGR